MSSSVRSFFRNKIMNIQQEQNSEDRLPSHFLLRDVNEWIKDINYQQNISCCGGNEKKNAIKKQVNAPHMIQETVELETNDQKIEHITQQHAPKIEIDDNLKDLFSKKEIKKAIINQLTHRALTGSMNSNNDNPPRICTKKHV